MIDLPESAVDPIPGVEIATDGLIVSYGDAFTLSIPRLQASGKIIALVGHNGSGKSTLIKTLLGLLTPRRGSISARIKTGNGMLQLLTPERHMAFSPENGSVFSDISVQSYIELWCRVKHRDPRYYRSEGAHYLETLQVTDLLPKLGRELSKGQRRRVQTAVGFLCAPRLFLFDEPFDGLDIQQSNHLANLFLSESRKMSILLSSHRMEVVEKLADVVLVLSRGELIAVGTPRTVSALIAKSSVTIGNVLPERSASLATILQSEVPNSVLEYGEKSLCLTGHGVTPSIVHSILHKHSLNGVEISEHTPSLSSAMAYQLSRK